MRVTFTAHDDEEVAEMVELAPALPVARRRLVGASHVALLRMPVVLAATVPLR